MSFKVFFTGFLNKKTYPKKNFLIENPLIKKEIEEKLYAELGLDSQKEDSQVPDGDKL